MTSWPSAGLMLGQRRRRWPTIKPALDERLVLGCVCSYGGERGMFDVRVIRCITRRAQLPATDV